MISPIDHLDSHASDRRGVVRVYIDRLDAIVAVSWRRDAYDEPQVIETYLELVEPFLDKVREYHQDVDLTDDEESFALDRVRR